MQQRVDIEDCDLEDSLVLYSGEPFTGLLFSNYEDGTLCEEQNYQDGLPHGLCQQFHGNGRLKRQWTAKNGRAEGKLIEFHANGVIALEESREYGVVLSSKKWDRQGRLIDSQEIQIDSEAYGYVKECRRTEN